MSRETALPLVIVAFVVLVVGGSYAWLDARLEAEAETQHQARVREREAAAAREIEEQRAESRELLETILPGVELGTDFDTVSAARPSGAITASTTRVDPGYVLYEERLAGGGQVMYAFDAGSHRLARVQVLSQLDAPEAIAPHLAAMHDEFGPPTGVWDCRDAGGIATRRFTWRRSHIGLADIILVYGTRISLTIYVTSNDSMGQSLDRAHCVPATDDRLELFPTSSTDDLERAAREEEERR